MKPDILAGGSRCYKRISPLEYKRYTVVFLNYVFVSADDNDTSVWYKARKHVAANVLPITLVTYK